MTTGLKPEPEKYVTAKDTKDAKERHQMKRPGKLLPSLLRDLGGPRHARDLRQERRRERAVLLRLNGVSFRSGDFRHRSRRRTRNDVSMMLKTGARSIPAFAGCSVGKGVLPRRAQLGRQAMDV